MGHFCYSDEKISHDFAVWSVVQLICLMMLELYFMWEIMNESHMLY